MSVDRALALLGLTGSPSQDEIRRAYLRKVKQHPPERDRDGFQQVRDAFDLLKAISTSSRQVGLVFDDEQPDRDFVEKHVVALPAPIPIEQSMAETEATFVAPGAPFVAPPWQPEIDRLNRGLADDDPVEAGAAMLALYSRPLTGSVPVPPALLCLQTITALVERNRFDAAQALLRAFEDFAGRHGLASNFGNELGARWKLTHELVALSELDEPLARAVGLALSNDWLPKAADAIEEALARGVEVEPYMRLHAPTIWNALLPYWKPPPEEVKRATGIRTPNWVLGSVGAAIVGLLRLCSLDTGPSPHVSYIDRPHVVDSPERRLEESVPPAASLSFRERAQRDVEAKWRSIAEAVQRGDCQTVREQWPGYKRVAEPELVNAPMAAAHKREILDMCAELTELLEETP